MTGRRDHVIVLAKAPVPGRVKTRLCPPCTFEQAAALAEAALADTLEAVAACGARRRIVALDGAPGPWLPAGFEVIAQRGDGLDERLANAWVDAGGPGIQIGMDTPQVHGRELDRLLDRLHAGGPPPPGGRAVLGPALDGGWWAIGLHGVDPLAAFTGVPMSTARTGIAQFARLRRLGAEVRTASVQRDLDTVGDVRPIAAAAPASRTARLAARLGLLADAA